MGENEVVTKDVCEAKMEDIKEMKVDVKSALARINAYSSDLVSIKEDIKKIFCLFEKSGTETGDTRLKCAKSISNIRTQTSFQWIVIVAIFSILGYIVIEVISMWKVITELGTHISMLLK